MKVRFTLLALTDIDDIFNSIASRSPKVAQGVEDRIREVTAAVSRFPGLGTPTDLAGVRRLPLGRYPYTLFYRVASADDAIDILRVVHGARITDLDQLPD